jgi:hypothetical protein
VLLRRALAVAVVLLLPALPSLGATRSPAPKTRVVTVPYSLPAGQTTGSTAYLWRTPPATAIALADEDKVTVSVTDRSGPVALLIKRVRNGVTAQRVVCAPLAISVNKGTQVSAAPLAGRCGNGKLSTPLGGTVTMVFHKRPKPKVLGAPPAMRWAVLVGINDYAGRTHSTVGGLGDVALIRTALIRAGWRSDHILVVRGDQATRENIRWAFGWLARHSTPRTFSLFHFSGHVCIASRGSCPSGHAYLWAQDNRFIPDTEVRSRMLQVRGYSWLDIAGCEAGAFDLHSATRLFSASSRADETSYENADWRLSVWSGLVWQRGFLEGYADDRRLPRRATIGEMLAYGRKHAPLITRGAQRGPQHPVVLGGRASWSLALPPGG